MLKPYGVAAFRSRQQVQQLADALRRNGINASIINTPQVIAIGCGLSVKFDLDDYPAVKRISSQLALPSFVGFYRVDSVGSQLKTSPLMKFID